jgi:hypothetical protein
MIEAALLRTVRNRAITFNILLVVSVLALVSAIVIHDDSQFVKFAGFFGAIGTVVFFLLSGSENESWKRARNGEAPYAD